MQYLLVAAGVLEGEHHRAQSDMVPAAILAGPTSNSPDPEPHFGTYFTRAL